MGYVLYCVSVLERIDLDGFVSFLVLVIVVQGVSLFVHDIKQASIIDFLGS